MSAGVYECTISGVLNTLFIEEPLWPELVWFIPDAVIMVLTPVVEPNLRVCRDLVTFNFCVTCRLVWDQKWQNGDIPFEIVFD